MTERDISRRDFLKVAGVAIAAVAIGGRLREADKQYSLDWLEHPENYTFRSLDPLPPQELRGVHVNSPFLWLESDTTIDTYLSTLAPWIRGVRVFVDDRFEPALGEYKHDMLPKLTAFAGKLSLMGKTISVDLSNGFTMAESWNPMYGKTIASSPYTKSGIHEMYTGPRYIDAYIQRVRALAPALRAIPNLAGVTIANELPRDKTSGGQQTWYRTVTPFVRDILPGVPILSGVADPRTLTGDIAGLTATTAHVYTHNLFTGGLFSFMQTCPIPVIIQECGIPDHLFGLPIPIAHDRLLAGHLKETLYQTTKTDFSTHEVWVPTSLYPWKVDAYNDSFSYRPDTDTESNKILRVFSDVTASI